MSIGAAMLSSAIAEKDIYIFKAMLPEMGYAILEQQRAHLNDDRLAEYKHCLWLLRESNVKGMLTIDFALWNAEKKQWQNSSIRMALTAKGWVKALNPAEVVMLENITAESAAAHEQSLTAHITGLNNGLFTTKNRLNPRKEQQTQAAIYTSYVDISEEGKLRSRMVDLSPGVKQAITCELSKQVFKSPVVMNRNMSVRVRGWEFINLYKGRSYEESELIALNVPRSCFYHNYFLAHAINRLGCTNDSKIESLAEDILVDGVEIDQLKEPQILPSGHSFSKSTIHDLSAASITGEMACPITRGNFRLNDVVENINLERFIQEWPLGKRIITAPKL